MEHRNRVNQSRFIAPKVIAPYIISCYSESLYCDLVLVCAKNRVVSCHKLVLCSLSNKLLSMCRDGDQSGEITYLHLPDFTHKVLKETVDEIYASIGKKGVEIQKTEVISVMGIESTLTKPQLIIPSLTSKAEVKEESRDYAENADFQSEEVELGDMIKAEENFDYIEEDEFDGNGHPSTFSKILESLNVIKYNDYTATRREFWEEDSVQVILKAINDEELNMKDAANLLGISYNNIYGKYREVFGLLKKNRGSKLQRIPNDMNSLNITEYNEYTGTRQEFWEEHSVNVLLRAVHEEELAMEAAAELLGLSQRILCKRYEDVFGLTYHSKPVETMSSRGGTSALHSVGTESVLDCDIVQDDAMDDFPFDDPDFVKDQEDEDSENKLEDESNEKEIYTTRSGRRTRQMVNKDALDAKQDAESNTDSELKQKVSYPKQRKVKPGPSGEKLLAQEEDPEVLELQKDFLAKEILLLEAELSPKRKGEKGEKSHISKRRKTAQDEDADYDPKLEVNDTDYDVEGGASGSESDRDAESDSENAPESESERQIFKDLRDLVSSCHPKPFTVKRAGRDFNLAPVQCKLRWRGLRKNAMRPCFATIVGVRTCQEDEIDPRLVKFNGELLKGRPLAWSFPESVVEMNEQYDAVTNAYRQVLGFSEEELHCNRIFFDSKFGDVEIDKDFPKKQLQRPRDHVKKQLAQTFRNMNQDALQVELKKRSEETPANLRKKETPTLILKYDRCRLQLDQNVEKESMEGLMVVVWHTDGQVIGKILNFDNNKDIFIGILRDVWVGVTNRSNYKLPFSKHIVSTYLSVLERALAPQLLQQLINGTAPSSICPTCGKIFTMLVEMDKERYKKHMQIHEYGNCGCKGVDKIDTLVVMERHIKLHHSDGKYMQCSIQRCPEVILKSLLDDHIEESHMHNIVCEECGKVFAERKKFRDHMSSYHIPVPCKVCGIKVLRVKMETHMIQNHRGDPIPCPTCGVKFADEKNIARHIRTVHTSNDKKLYQCPYQNCEKAFRGVQAFLNHLNNIHFKIYLYICEFNCPGARYKELSNFSSHYRKKHGQKVHGKKYPTLEDLLKTMTEEESVHHESILRASGDYDKLVAQVGSGLGGSNIYNARNI